MATNWITAVAAVAALVLSLVTYTQVNREPDVRLFIPKVMRLAFPKGPTGQPAGPRIWLQPAFTVDNQSEIAAVVDTTYIDVQPSSPDENGERVEFLWWETDQYDESQPEGGIATLNFASYPAPFVVARNEPKTPILYFNSQRDEFLEVGQWQAALHVQLAGGRTVTEHFCIDIDTEARSALERFNFILLRNDLQGPTATHCFRHWF